MARKNIQRDAESALASKWLSLFALAGIIVGVLFDILYVVGFGGTVCILGFHIHHLFIGLMVLLFGIGFFPLPRFKHWAMFMIGLGLAIFLHDFVIHFVIGNPFLIFC